jgi:hypothetical protein
MPSNTPIASYYARTPSAMRAMRMLLQAWPERAASALYIGCARGEDFYSWYPVGWGTGVEIEWSAMDCKFEAVQYCQLSGPNDVNYLFADYLDSMQHYDFIIASRMWTKQLARDAEGVAMILRARPAVLFTRGLGTAMLDDVDSNYEIYTHRDQADDHRSDVKGLVFIRRGVFEIESLSAPEVKLCPLA